MLKRAVIAIIIVAFASCWFYPGEYWTCHGSYKCYGCVFRYHNEKVMLNAKKSVLEIEKDPVNICLGYKQQERITVDGCNRGLMWYDKRPVDCEEILQRCHAGDSMPLGVECKEWQRACDELSKNATASSVKIKDYDQTGIAVRCNRRPALFPGGESQFIKFLNSNFRYPDSLTGQRVDGTLGVSFSLDTTGCLKQVFFGEPSLHDYYKTEASRVLTMMPSWSPARCDSRKVESRENFLFHFSNSDSLYRNIKVTVSRIE